VSTINENFLYMGTGVRVTAKMNAGTEYNLYTGFIEAMDKDLSLEPTVTITCVDAMAQLAKLRSNIDTNNLTDDVAVDRILTNAGWTGTSTLTGTNYTVSSVPTGNALDMIDAITSPQLGLFWVDSDGNAVWRNGSYFATGSFAGAYKWFTMTDARTSTDVVEYDDISVIAGEKYMRNTINTTNTRTDGVVQTITKFNTASTGRFGPVAANVEMYFAAANASTATQNLADQFANPAYRVDKIGFDCLGFSTDLWNRLTRTDLGNAVIVKRTPIYTSELTYNCWVQEVTHDITPNNWRMSLTLSPAT
jgi:hypothetical protein